MVSYYGNSASETRASDMTCRATILRRRFRVSGVRVRGGGGRLSVAAAPAVPRSDARGVPHQSYPEGGKEQARPTANSTSDSRRKRKLQPISFTFRMQSATTTILQLASEVRNRIHNPDGGRIQTDILPRARTGCTAPPSKRSSLL